ncbi:hypothetical protein Daura_28415 [Dactylosporangium aurantiacum]|uniref:Uncharacterized protein n=1 Tax=Dactylosporangium aurantiacum TaxID=35754 RepID=A0A9Q9IB33_9ACTN|nr:hypothetical protein [Dactylosporangium aurantiacum]MDG6110467.1 hypothetical protein [Dactylosporangium aurantiacum]UWZ50737.1 hypothetical protein Daura_28415 [Dactylosporangium aurantiacum]
MTYTADKPLTAESSAALRARIPGWGADLDPRDRPSVPREKFDPGLSGAPWDFPERQQERRPRERSIEHAMLPPVFGTSCPPRGLSGVLRRFAYRRYSEARAAHWLLLLAADRVDVAESRVRSALHGHPDPVIPTGLRSEVTHHGLASRLRRRRTDLVHQPIDVVLQAVPWVLGGVAVAALVRRARPRTARPGYRFSRGSAR